MKAILILIYWGIITPVALIMRVLGIDPLCRKIDKGRTSYWIKRPVSRPTKEMLERGS